MSTIAVTREKPRGSTGERKVRSAFARCTKRLMDLAGASVGIALSSPALMLSAALVKLADGGPVLHRRRVVGQTGEFDAFKFRTMRIDADRILQQNPELRAEYERNFKLRDDPRVTRVGGFLRRYSLDELPQLFNVLRGEMSLVGPRMITIRELDKYGTQKSLIRSVKPGLTGYWQINGRQNTSYAERVAMDAYYIDNWSLLLDTKILCLTPIRVLKGEGAY